MASSNIHTLIFAEPNTFDYARNYIVLDVNDDLYKLIQAGGEEHRDCNSNAYVFGSLFDIDDYEHAGHHEVLQGQTGLIEKTGAKTKHKAGYLTCDYEDFVGKPKFNDGEFLKKIQKTHPEISWIGEVIDNNTKCHLHFHVSPQDVVDSVIVDNNFFLIAHSESDTDNSDASYTSGDDDGTSISTDTESTGGYN